VRAVLLRSSPGAGRPAAAYSAESQSVERGRSSD
jgi:hypothetical protein